MKTSLKCLVFLLLITSSISAQRIKDLAFFKGINSEQILGYGLVVGLSGTGDSYRSSFTIQSVTSMLKRMGITVPESNLRTRNIAAVMVTARVNNLLTAGGEFDVVVSSMGDATSLLGGTLLMTPMAGSRGAILGSAQGPISIGGYDINTSSGGRIAKNHALSGRVPNGGVLETEVPGGDLNAAELSLILRDPDFTTLNNIATAINAQFGNGTANSSGASEIKINVPQNSQQDLTGFLATLESIQVQKDVIAKVVLNERTGTVVAGNNVIISPVSISHGSLNITIRSFPIISQPSAFASGETAVFNNLIPAANEKGNVVNIDGASNAQEVAAALNSLNVSPRDIIAIFQALKEAGALTAELVII